MWCFLQRVNISCFAGSRVKLNVKKYLNFVSARQKSTNSIMKVLNVAEKNDAAKNIAGYLSRGNLRKRDGLSVYNKIYEFKVSLWGKECQMIMTSVSGHLLGHEFTGSYRNWRGCHPLSLFDAPVTKECTDENYVKIKKTLEREVRGSGALIIWTDCDREGENIGFEIIQVCQAIKPNIKVYRAKFSEITQVSINRALQTLGEPNKTVSDAVDVRSELDLRIGAAFTRFQTLRLQQVFPRTLANMLISYGSCQFPTLGFVVERFLAIERFKPEPYWKLKVMDVRNEVSVEFRWQRMRLFEELPCQVLLDICLEQPDAKVVQVKSKPKSKWRPVPLDTIELEKQGSRKLRLNAKETMKIAEKLYTQGYISYPRTETNIFPKELNLTPLVEQQIEHPQWGQFAQRLLQDGLAPRQGKKCDNAHPPIHPTKYTNSLQGNEAKVYEFVVRHFLACLSKNAEGHETIVDIDIAGEQFTANGLQIFAKHYLEVYIYEKWSDKEIHHYQEGHIFRPTSIEMVQETTSPPNLLTEADLIALMDKHGIGTDATHADHIDTIKSRHYVGLTDGRYFMPGKLGIGLVMGYDNMGFQMSKPNLRAELEKDLQMICEGRKDPKVVLQSQIDKYRDVFKVAMERANLIDTALANYLEEQPTRNTQVEIAIAPQAPTVFKCPKCGSDMVLKDKRQGSGKYITCMGYPSCNNAIWFPQGVEDVEVLDELCRSCSGSKKKLKFKFRTSLFPLFGPVYETCIGGCYPDFNEMLGIRLESVRRTQRADDTGYSSGHSNISQPPTSSNNSNRPQNSNSARSQSSNSARSQSSNSSRLQPSSSARSQPSSSARSQPSNSSRDNTQNRNQKKLTQLPAVNNTQNNRRPQNTMTNGSASVIQQNNTRITNDTINPGTFNQGRNQSNNLNSFDIDDWGKLDEKAVIVCNCNKEAIQLTVRKDGPNQGRIFYTCAKPRDSGCSFFLWGDSDPKGDVRPSSANQRIYTPPNNTTVRNDVVCGCQHTAKLLTVQKDGPNKGRQFYTCPKGMNNGCNFFQWADVDATNDDPGTSWGTSSNASSSTRGKRRDVGNGHTGRTPKKPRASGTKRKCGVCGIEGHTRKTCPQNVLD